MSRIEKPWGYEEVLEINNEYLLKKLFMKTGCRCSLQYHEKKKETIYTLDGILSIQLNEGTFTFNPGDSITIEPKAIHRMTAIKDCTYLEASSPLLDDVVRVSDDYGR